MAVTDGYCTLDEIKSAIEKAGGEDDQRFELLIGAASRSIDNFCRRPDGFIADTTASARIFAGNGHAVQWIDECVEITLVAVKDAVTDTTYTSWSAGDWIAGSGDPEHAPDFNRTPYLWMMVDPTGDYDKFTSGRYAWRRGFKPEVLYTGREVPTVQVTARWGYASTVPETIKAACIMQVARWYKRLQSAMADTVASADMGQLMYRQSLDPEIKHLLVEGRFVRPAVG